MLSPSPANMTVSDYCAAMDRGEIKINSSYQRSDKVWPPAARSYLIESVLLGFPIPKIYHHSITNVKTKRSIREIIDGQQRSKAIHDFYSDHFRLTGPSIHDDLKGRLYSELDPEWQGRFLTYLMSIDLFTGAEDTEVRQLFRRMNSYTVPLNPEEMRHATFQGEFKWFIADVAEQFQPTLREFGILSEKAITRMQDLKLLTECAHALQFGIKTTNKSSLNRIYELFDAEFDEEPSYQNAFEYALTNLQKFDNISQTSLNRPFIVYSILIALLSHQREIPDFPNEFDHGVNIDLNLVASNFEILSDALELDDNEIAASPFCTFITACSERTNVKDQRETRVKWFMRAFEESLEDL